MWGWFLISLFFSLGDSQRPQQQWYLTGKNFNDERNTTKYRAETINIWSISTTKHGRDDESAINSTHSSFGGAVAVFVGHNSTLDATIEKLLQEVLRPHFQTEYQLTVVDVWHYDLFVSVDQETPLQYEIGLYDLPTSQWLKYSIHQVKLGKEWRIICNITVVQENSVVTQEVHRFAVTSDLYHTLTITQHTWEAIETEPLLTSESPIEHEADGHENGKKEEEDTVSLNLRVMTYNIWHNNPPAWLLHDNNKRWKWYQKRMRHLAKMIFTQSPDVITLQEVRLDNTFPPKTKSVEQLIQYGYQYHFHDDSEAVKSALFSDPTGSQLHHVLRYLHQSYLHNHEHSQSTNQTNECILISPESSECLPVDTLSKNDLNIFDHIFDKYQFVYQPAMSMYEREHMGKRVEEGIAILVKNNFRSSPHTLQVSKIQTLFLPRNFDDSSDDHHRAVLHLELQLRSHHHNHNHNHHPMMKIDVMTTHMSLSSNARDESVKAIWNYTSTECKGDIQILTGDFNAEPHENSYGCLTGRCENAQDPISWSEIFKDGDCPCQSHQGPYRDSWLHSANELRGYHNQEIIENGMNKYSAVEKEGYTYPPCNPEKRIDFILLRNQTNENSSRWKGQIQSSWLAGKEVTDDTAHLVSELREGLGMLDKDSPIWASDHFAVVSDIKLFLTPID